MNDSALTPDRILDAAEDVLRRYGPAKTTVVDVAQALGVSHGSIYRHFSSKAALRDAVAERWLHRISKPLAAIAAENGPAVDRLHQWLERLFTLKRQKVLDDPEMFATYHAIAEAAREVVQSHVDELVGQLTLIMESGRSRGEFQISHPRKAANAILNATVRFHHPAHASEWNKADINEDFVDVWKLILGGLVQESR